MRRRLFVALALTPVFALAGPKGKGKAKGHGKKYDDDSPVVYHSFREQDMRIIREYYHGGRGLPPGLAKRGGDLPPGLEKQLERKGTLPPGLQKKLTPFPIDLERRLPPVPRGYRRVIVGRRVLLVRENTVYDSFGL